MEKELGILAHPTAFSMHLGIQGKGPPVMALFLYTTELEPDGKRWEKSETERNSIRNYFFMGRNCTFNENAKQ